MNTVIEELFQSIGNQILDMVGDDVSKALAYAEADDGVISVSLFFARQDCKIPIFNFGGKDLSDLFYSLREEWGKQDAKVEWSSSAYFISNGKPTLEVIYPDKFNKEVSESVRRSAIVEKYFGSARIDYSQV
ncbi:immunity protein YezG family protein [Aquitalea aquatica]|uniref:Uncharacterized protein n=1 Tax=Aquitalea aquatica TaxID=3044273 RepID=A0A838YEC0_9NEIS|nr:hypothetical protein [Aquitalea magnusonii]MBA4710869.1 hypothetical protein [Aquitalea magnusonii]